MRRAILTVFCAAGVFTGTAIAAEACAQLQKKEISAMTRAEVLADLDMWNRAGLNKYSSAHGYTEITQSSDYQNRLSQYLRLRNGPDYQMAVHKLSAKAGEK